LAELIGSDTNSITLEDVPAALASIAGAMMIARAVGDEALSELIFIPAIPPRIALGRSGGVGERRM
jgi:hypothetical protein